MEAGMRPRGLFPLTLILLNVDALGVHRIELRLGVPQTRAVASHPGAHQMR